MISFIKPFLIATIFFSVVMAQAVSGRFKILGPAGASARTKFVSGSPPAMITMEAPGASPFEVWDFFTGSQPGTNVIGNSGSRAYTSLTGPPAPGIPVVVGPDPKRNEWIVMRNTATGRYVIGHPTNKTLVWTVVSKTGAPNTVILLPFNGSPAQTFALQPAN